jgi:hypothetical protein
MQPTEQDIIDYMNAIEAHGEATKDWCDAAIESLSKNEAIGGNPPSPPPPPPGTHH